MIRFDTIIDMAVCDTYLKNVFDLSLKCVCHLNFLYSYAYILTFRNHYLLATNYYKFVLLIESYIIIID